MSSTTIEAVNPIGQSQPCLVDSSGHLIISGTTGGGGTDAVPDKAPVGTHTTLSSVGLFGQNDSPTADTWRALQVNGDGELKVQTSNAGTGDNVLIKGENPANEVVAIQTETDGKLISSNFGTSNATPPVITPLEVNADGKLQVQIVGSVDINGSAPHRHLTIDANGRTLTVPQMTATNNAIASTTASIVAQTTNDSSGLCRTGIQGKGSDTTQKDIACDDEGNISTYLRTIDPSLLDTTNGLKVSVMNNAHGDTNNINLETIDTALVNGALGLKVSVENNPQVELNDLLITDDNNLACSIQDVDNSLVGVPGTTYNAGFNVNVINPSGTTPDGSGTHRDFYTDTSNFSTLNTQASGNKITFNTNTIYGPSVRSSGAGTLPSAMNPVCVNASGNLLTGIHGLYYDDGQVPSLTSGQSGEIMIGRTGALRTNKNYLALTISTPNGGIYSQPEKFSSIEFLYTPLLDSVLVAPLNKMLNAVVDMSSGNSNQVDSEVQHITININMETNDPLFLVRTKIPLESWGVATYYAPSSLSNDIDSFELIYSTDGDTNSGQAGYKASILTANTNTAHWKFVFKYNGIIPYRYVIPFFFMETPTTAPTDNPNMTASFYAG